MKNIAAFAITAILLTHSLLLAETEKQPGIAEKVKEMKKHSGYFDFYWDKANGKVWLEIDKWDQEFLYVNSLPAGVGSNDIGLDRGQLGDNRVVKFQRIGPKVLLVQPNYAFRAVSDNSAEQESVEQAFAQSVLWGAKVAAIDGKKVLVDMTGFLLADAHDVTGTLAATGQGSYKLDETRSAIYMNRTKSFPKNSEFEATLTFVGAAKGRYVRQVVPSSNIVTVRQHHSFVELPNNKYQARVSDPRAGYWGIRFKDYATPISKSLEKRFIARHRLQKKKPNAEVSKAVKPIVYYLDRGAPEPIRSALLDGAGWWNQAFEAIGYKDAFQVKMLPDDADPMDVRYNVIQWVHRATRGWSYGSAVTDPRTGEIIKGVVILGSLRVRQDFLIAQGLLSPYGEQAAADTSIMLEMALARLRQLAAHEVGHTIGLIHNFAASAANRASVMDYPHPYVQFTEGKLDFSQAYATGIGEWDKAAVAYGYSDFPDHANEREELQKIIQQTVAKGMIFISDRDARAAGGAHPDAHLWDNGADAADELLRIMQVRQHALQKFSEKNIPIGAPMSSLEEALVPLYLSHRYQVNAASKLLGGLYYTYAMRGDGQKITGIVQPVLQRKALAAILTTLSAEALALPESILQIIPPRAEGYDRNRETFDIRTSVTLDPLSAAETAARQTLQFLLHPARATRLVEFHSRNEQNPGLDEVIDEILLATWKTDRAASYHAEIQRVVDTIALDQLIELRKSGAAATQARAIASVKLDDLKQWCSENSFLVADPLQAAHLRFAAEKIKQLQENPGELKKSTPVETPAGSPIGVNFMCDMCDF